MSNPRRGELYWVNWNSGRGSEQTGHRPSLIISTNAANTNDRYGNVVVACLTSKGRDDIATHVPMNPSKQNGLPIKSWVKCEQILTISKERLGVQLGEIDSVLSARVDGTLKKVLALE